MRIPRIPQKKRPQGRTRLEWYIRVKPLYMQGDLLWKTSMALENTMFNGKCIFKSLLAISPSYFQLQPQTRPILIMDIWLNNRYFHSKSSNWSPTHVSWYIFAIPGESLCFFCSQTIKSLLGELDGVEGWERTGPMFWAVLESQYIWNSGFCSSKSHSDTLQTNNF